MKASIMSLLVAMVLLACGKVLAPYVPLPDREYTQAPQEVFQTALSVITDTEWPLEEVDGASMFLRTEWVQVRGTTVATDTGVAYLVDCSSSLNRSHNGSWQLTVLVTGRDGESSVRVREAGRGINEYWTCRPTNSGAAWFFTVLDERLGE